MSANANTSNIHDINSKDDASSDKKEMSTFGAIWRVGGVLIIFVAVIAAIAFGINFGMAYIVALGLSAAVTLALKIALGALGFIVSGYVGYKTGSVVGKVVAAHIATAAEQKAAAA